MFILGKEADLVKVVKLNDIYACVCHKTIDSTFCGEGHPIIETMVPMVTAVQEVL